MEISFAGINDSCIKESTVLGCNHNRMISVCLEGKPFNIIAIKVYAPTSNAEETEAAEAEQFYEDLQGLLELTPKKDDLFIIGEVTIEPINSLVK